MTNMEYDLDDVPTYEGWDHKTLREEARALYIENTDLRAGQLMTEIRLNDVKRENERLRTQNAAVNRENERLSLTPEVKADVEAAYQRGYQAARRNLRSWAAQAVVDLENRLTDSAQEPVDKYFGITRMGQA